VGENRTSEQVREQHLRDMGPELGPVYNALYNDVVWLHMRWKLYRQLFAKSPERLDLLNETAGFFFHVVQDTLWEDVVLQLAKLTDSPKSAGKDNLSLRCLPTLVSDQSLRSEIDSLLDAALSACGFARKWRNRRLAHRDLGLALATGGDPLPGVSRADIEGALLAFRKLLNRLELHYWNSTVGYEHSLVGPGDGDSLVYHLNRAVRAEREQQERLRSGRFVDQDIAPDEEV
jgi:hypothetical protein